MKTIVVLAVAEVLAAVPAVIAYRRGRTHIGWYFYGMLLFPVALVHALRLKAHQERGVPDALKAVNAGKSSLSGPRRYPVCLGIRSANDPWEQQPCHERSTLGGDSDSEALQSRL